MRDCVNLQSGIRNFIIYERVTSDENSSGRNGICRTVDSGFAVAAQSCNGGGYCAEKGGFD